MSLKEGLKKLAGWIMNPGSAVTDLLYEVIGRSVGLSDDQRKEMRQHRYETAKLDAENQRIIKKAKIDYKVKKLDYKAERYKQTDSGDLSYDQMIIKANQNSIFDEIVASIFLLLILFTIFVPVYYQVKSGQPIDLSVSWNALAEAPWWFGFAVVGIIVSRLGLMRFFRLWINRFPLGGNKGKRTSETPRRSIKAESEPLDRKDDG
jgi:hypothetical protein